MNVLVVEDDEVSRRILRRSLSRLGYTVSQASDGAEAWALLQRESIRIVVSDWTMPQMDGLALCRLVRERTDGNYTYFILLTGHQGDEDYREAMAAGADDFLTKPVDREELQIRLLVARRILKFTTQVRQLKTLLPICIYCKKIRDDHDYWEKMETYIHEHTGTDFSHSICPDCYEKVALPEMEAEVREVVAKSTQQEKT
ncbi:MAG TPA: response regulator [Verrucomicrobiae bacterium]|nr:response regulator [Verrucomicrobiae bacterium]